MHIHFTSATSLPLKVPLVLARSVNRRMVLHLRSTVCNRFLGVVAMDFPSASLCELIVRRNCRSLDPCRPALSLGGCPETCDRIMTLQCELMTATTKADAANLENCDA